MRKHVYGYTMIEILMVIVIAAILFGIGIPAFSTMIRGNAMTVSIRQLTAKIQAARSYAVTNRCKVAILFPAAELVSLKPAFSYSSYRVCVVSGDSSPFTFESWIDGEEWKRLPTGILIQKITNPAIVNTCPSADIGGGSATYNFSYCLVFKADGQLTVSSSPVFALVYGRYVSGTGIVNTEREGGNVVYHPVTVTPFTGKMTVSPATTTEP